MQSRAEKDWCVGHCRLCDYIETWHPRQAQITRLTLLQSSFERSPSRLLIRNMFINEGIAQNGEHALHFKDPDALASRGRQ